VRQALTRRAAMTLDAGKRRQQVLHSMVSPAAVFTRKASGSTDDSRRWPGRGPSPEHSRTPVMALILENPAPRPCRRDCRQNAMNSAQGDLSSRRAHHVLVTVVGKPMSAPAFRPCCRSRKRRSMNKPSRRCGVRRKNELGMIWTSDHSRLAEGGTKGETATMVYRRPQAPRGLPGKDSDRIDAEHGFDGPMTMPARSARQCLHHLPEWAR